MKTWLGQRPSLPDGLPVIGASRKHPKILYNFGDGHLGLTLAATSARLIVAYITGRNHNAGLAGASPDGF